MPSFRFQRFKRNILPAAPLLWLACLCLAALQPFMKGGESGQRHG